MADVETMLEWAGYETSWDLIQSKMTEEQLKDLFQELWAECEYEQDIVAELVDKMGFIDYESARADYEDVKMQEWKDMRRGVE